MHIGMGLVCGSKIKDMVRAGFDFVIFLADWHSWINNKLGGSIENIRACGEYFKHCFAALGIKSDKVQYLWASDIAKDTEYWEMVVQIAKSATLQRTWRALPIMGREMNMRNIETALLFYPCMQVADIFHMNLDVACAGLDQRKAHMLARDIGEKLHWKKPSNVHTHLLMGLQGPQKTKKQFDEDINLDFQISSKMYKSIPGSCIFIHDDSNSIRTKIMQAYCPPKEVAENPILEFVKYIIFPENGRFNISRAKKFGGPIAFKRYEDLEGDYLKGEIHPLDLKQGVAEALVDILKPVRDYFSRHQKALETMMKIEITR